MELEEMKTLWQEMSKEIENQKKLTDSLIIKMTQADYKNKINKILIPEAAGTLVAFTGVLFILINLQNLKPWYLLVCGIISAFILLLLPILSMRAIYKMRSLNILDNSYKQSLLEYSKGKIQFVFVQKLSFYLSPILMVVVVPVMGKLFAGKDTFKMTGLWIWYFIAFLFVYAFGRWVFKSYIKTTEDAENILKELES